MLFNISPIRLHLSTQLSGTLLLIPLLAQPSHHPTQEQCSCLCPPICAHSSASDEVFTTFQNIRSIAKMHGPHYTQHKNTIQKQQQKCTQHKHQRMVTLDLLCLVFIYFRCARYVHSGMWVVRSCSNQQIWTGKKHSKTKKVRAYVQE